MNVAFMLAYNNADMTRDAVISVMEQTIPVTLVVLNNGSTDHTREVLSDLEREYGAVRIRIFHNESNVPPTVETNEWLRRIFWSHKHLLCMANDIVLPPSFYEEMLKWPRGIVAASQINDRSVYDEYIKTMPPVSAVNENTHMAVILLRRWLYDAVMAKDGYFFDERFVHYCSDCDLALRISACGIRGVQLNLPFWHYGSASHKLAPPEDGDRMRREADGDRNKFYEKYGFAVFDQKYTDAASDVNFKG